MILKDLLLSTPASDIISVLSERYGVPDEKRERFAQAHIQLIDSLKSIEPVDTGHLLLGITYFDDGRDSIDVSLFSKKELASFDCNSELASIQSIDELEESEIERLCGIPAIPQTYGFELAPWSEVLGYELSENNVQDFGGENICAAAIYEMTFFGYTEAAVDAKRQELYESIRESEEVSKFPDEEQKKYYISYEELCAEFGIELLTEEEEAANHRKICRELLINMLRRFRALTFYAP